MFDSGGRIKSVRALERVMERVASEVTEQFLERHPDWVEHYGQRARQHGIQDALYHMRFLAASIEAGAVEIFEDYVMWAARVLQARQIAPHLLAENLTQIRNALEARLTPEEASLLASYLNRGIFVLDTPPASGVDEAQESGGLAQLSRLFTQAALHGERRAAAQIAAEALREGVEPLDIYLHVLQDSLYRIGRLWESNQVTVAQEHMATAITQYVVTTLYCKLPTTPARRGNMVLTGVQGELHQVGGMMAADILESDGWNVRFLGTDMPLRGIVEAVKTHEADVLGVSLTMPFNITAAKDLVAACREAMAGRALCVIVGGGAWRHAPEAYKEVGAENCAADILAGREYLRALLAP